MKLEFDMQEISYIAGVVAERPYKECAALIKKLEAMVNAELAKEQAPVTQEPNVAAAPVADVTPIPAADNAEAK